VKADLRAALIIISVLMFLGVLASIATTCGCTAQPEQITVTSSKDPATAPTATTTYYRMRCQIGPEIAGILPAYVTRVEVTKSVAQLRREWLWEYEKRQKEWAFEQEREYFDDMRAIGLPLLVIGLILTLAGLVFTVTRLKAFFVYGPEAVVLGGLAVAFGVTMLRYPKQIGWTCAGAAVVVIVNALIRARQNALAVKTTTEVVRGVDAAKPTLSGTARAALKKALSKYQSQPTRDYVKALRGKAASVMHDTAPEL
jgi:hypothetical protein